MSPYWGVEVVRIIVGPRLVGAVRDLLRAELRSSSPASPSQRNRFTHFEQVRLLTEEDRDALAEEGERLVRFLAEPEGAEAFEVRFAEPRVLDRLGHQKR